uniref:3Beta_HSD domain-containing protein n=1 Tax=Rhabditophanes sp. KR3021 TaxID=114890 RepID=A0AC35TZK6_9BILA
MSNIVVVTGASGFVGQHLIKYFHDNHGTLNIKEIRSVDLKPFKPDIDINLKIYMKHHQMDVCDEAKLEKVFEGASCIYHLAQKGMDHYYSNYSADITTSYWSKNINSIESVVNCMVSKDIQNIVFLGNAYCNLARCDNFGLSEDNYKGLSNSGYILGTYGETKSRAELFLRTFAENNTTVSGKKLQVICVRPTIVYGEGNCKTLNALLDICNQNDGVFPYCSGSRGLHQYVGFEFLFT